MENQLLMLDVEDPSWQKIAFKESAFSLQQGQIGVVPLSQRNATEFIIFGGITIMSDNDRSYSTEVYKLALTEKSPGKFESKLTLMPTNELTVSDRIYFNTYFYDDRDETRSTIIVPSREALHIFDTKAQRYVSSDEARAYKALIPPE